jgi:hypothetical protein
MTKPDCDQVVMAVMAMADGYQPGLSTAELDSHLDGCAECRHQLEKLHGVVHLLDAQERRLQTEDVWQLVEKRLVKDSSAPGSQALMPFIFLGLGLLGYRLVEMVPDRNLNFVWKIVPLLFAIATFGYLRVNPFKINPDLRFEGE